MSTMSGGKTETAYQHGRVVSPPVLDENEWLAPTLGAMVYRSHEDSCINYVNREGYSIIPVKLFTSLFWIEIISHLITITRLIFHLFYLSRIIDKWFEMD